MKIIFGLAPLLLVAACTSQPRPVALVQTKLISVNVPPALLDCGNAPRPPVHAHLQSDVARYLVELWAWGGECHSHLQAVKQSLADVNSSNTHKGS